MILAVVDNCGDGDCLRVGYGRRLLNFARTRGWKGKEKQKRGSASTQVQVQVLPIVYKPILAQYSEKTAQYGPVWPSMATDCQ